MRKSPTKRAKLFPESGKPGAFCNYFKNLHTAKALVERMMDKQHEAASHRFHFVSPNNINNVLAEGDGGGDKKFYGWISPDNRWLNSIIVFKIEGRPKLDGLRTTI